MGRTYTKSEMVASLQYGIGSQDAPVAMSGIGPARRVTRYV